MSIKTIIMDVDGTLTNQDKKIPSLTKQALLSAQKNGIKLILASGRPITGLMDLACELEMDQHHGLLVCFNGSQVVDAQTKEILFNEAMTIEEGKAVLEHLKKFEVKPMIIKGNYLYVNDVYDCMLNLEGKPFNIIQYESRGGKFLLCEHNDLAAFVDYPLNKILIAGEADYLKEHYQEIAQPFVNQLSCMFTAPMFYEITAKGIDKAKALDTVLRPMNIMPEEMMAFGDGQNDASMLEYVGLGIAMGNAIEELKQMADDITASNNEEGIAKALAKYLN